LRQWVSLGLDPESYWRIPVRQFDSIISGANDKLIREHNELAWLAWHIGLLSQPRKRYPSLKSLMVQENKKPSQTWQQQLAIAHMWASQGYGKIGRIN
jgi:hypothetical protein